MRLSRKFWIILGIGVLVVLIAILASTYVRQTEERRQLDDRLTLAQTRLPGLISEQQDLEGQLAQARSFLETSQARFPQAVESIEYGEDLFRIAYGYDLRTMFSELNLELTSLTASPPAAGQAGAVTYSVSTFTIAVSGDVNNILKFIDALGTQIDYQLPWTTQEPWSVQVNSVNFNVAGRAATISLDVYGYKR